MSCSRASMRAEAIAHDRLAGGLAGRDRAHDLGRGELVQLGARAARALVCVEPVMASPQFLPARGGRAGDLAEHRARGEPRAAGIVEIEQPADQLARRIEPADRLVVGIEHLAVGVDAHAAEREGDAARDRIAFERRRIDRVRPVALVDREPDGAPAILDVGIERDVLLTAALYSAMVLRNCSAFTPSSFCAKLLERIRRSPW